MARSTRKPKATRTPAQQRATRKVIALNKQRARGAAGAKKTARRPTRRANPSTTVRILKHADSGAHIVARGSQALKIFDSAREAQAYARSLGK